LSKSILKYFDFSFYVPSAGQGRSGRRVSTEQYLLG
jgi:hypothetical protein